MWYIEKVRSDVSESKIEIYILSRNEALNRYANICFPRFCDLESR